MLDEALARHGEHWDDVEDMALAVNPGRWYGDEPPPPSLDAPFDTGYGGPEGCHFTVWTGTRVYFPACYDGSEWVASVPRFPNGEAVAHVGGG